MFNILNYNGNANQNDIEIPSQSNQNGCQQEKEVWVQWLTPLILNAQEGENRRTMV
jgi:hypothetical protein